MNHCESCKHWKRGDDQFAAEVYEKAGLVYADHGECLKARNYYEDFDAVRPRETLAWAEDGESYKAGLTTHKTFGCVQWEAKP